MWRRCEDIISIVALSEKSTTLKQLAKGIAQGRWLAPRTTKSQNESLQPPSAPPLQCDLRCAVAKRNKTRHTATPVRSADNNSLPVKSRNGPVAPTAASKSMQAASLHPFAISTSLLSSLLCSPHFCALFTSLPSWLLCSLHSSASHHHFQFSVARMYLGCFSFKFRLIRRSNKNKASSFLGHDGDHKLHKEPLNTSHCVTSTSLIFRKVY